MKNDRCKVRFYILFQRPFCLHLNGSFLETGYGASITLKVKVMELFFLSGILVANALEEMYVECGSKDQARDLLKKQLKEGGPRDYNNYRISTKQIYWSGFRTFKKMKFNR